jgi:hypothetical protein
MTPVDSIQGRQIGTSISRAVLPVFPPGKAQGSTQHQPGKAPIRVVEVMPSQGDLESQVQLMQRRVNPGGASSRSLYAVRAYQSLASDEEKDKISRLLGVDEYA